VILETRAGGELEVTLETDKAYLLQTEDDEEVWMPKSAFNDDSILEYWGEKMLIEKLEEYEG